MFSVRPAAQSHPAGPSARGFAVIQKVLCSAAVYPHRDSPVVGQIYQARRRRRPQETTVENIVEIETRLLTVLGNSVVDVEHSSSGENLTLWAWRSSI